MPPGQDPYVDVSQIEQARRQINRLQEEIAQLSESELSPPEYYGEFLQRVMTAISAPAGAVWICTPQRNLQLQYQVNMRQVGLDRTDTSRGMHDELLRQFAMKGQPGMVPPQSSMGPTEGGGTAPGNPTDFLILLAPILYDKQLQGLVEIWQDNARGGPDVQRGFLQFVIRMAALASGYTRNHQLRQMVGQQQVWTQLETFARQIHNSLNPAEVAYLIANEGRRLVDVDRVCVALCMGNKAVVEAISGTDVVEKRSNLVTLMRALFNAVLDWGEKLVFIGTKDDTLPPAVLLALDEYLAESNSKLLVVLPLKDDREANKKKKKARSALLMECFDTNATPEQALARLEVIGRHSTSALYNASEYKRIPLRYLWLPIAKVQEGLGGKAKAITALATIGVVLLLLAMFFVPYPLKMEAKGQVLPKDRQGLFAPIDGIIRDIPGKLTSGTQVTKNQELFEMYSDDLQKQINQLKFEILSAETTLKANTSHLGGDAGSDNSAEVGKAKVLLTTKQDELISLVSRNNAVSNYPGVYHVKAPMTGIILSGEFRDTLLNRFVRSSEPLLRIGKTDPLKPKISDWEAVLKIPQKHIGQVLEAFVGKDPGTELDVDLLLVSAPTRTYKGKLKRDQIAAEANLNHSDNNEPEPVVLAKVRLDGNDIPPESRIPPEALVSDVEVHTWVRCGNHALGYSLFYGVWEFFYEKVVFFF